MILAGSTLPRRLYRAAQSRALDRMAAARQGLTPELLMERAGRAAWQLLRMLWPRAGRIAVLCGSGNNGGDGLVVARLAHAAGLDVRVLYVTRPPACGAVLARWQATGVGMEPCTEAALQDREVLVDALLGTGLDRAPVGDMRAAVVALSARSADVLALDVPSGLHADTGRILGVAVCARATLSFVVLKQGLLTGEGPHCSGALYHAGLGVSTELSGAAVVWRVDAAARVAALPPRRRTAHKGNFGHVLVIGGDHGYGGAVRLAGMAAARVGAGRVSVATRHCGTTDPELMVHVVESADTLPALLRRVGVLALGPGLGQAQWGSALLACALESALPAVVDADALNLLAAWPQRRAAPWILTPHPGEAARLLGCTVADIQADRFTAARRLQARYAGVVVLKGAGTVIADGRSCTVVQGGNPGMACGGTGDVLTGVIAGLWVQGHSAVEAARTGAALHAAAGDAAALDGGERGLLAGDLLPWVRRLANP